MALKWTRITYTSYSLKDLLGRCELRYWDNIKMDLTDAGYFVFCKLFYRPILPHKILSWMFPHTIGRLITRQLKNVCLESRIPVIEGMNTDRINYHWNRDILFTLWRVQVEQNVKIFIVNFRLFYFKTLKIKFCPKMF